MKREYLRTTLNETHCWNFFEKLALILLINFHRKHSLLKLIIKKLSFSCILVYNFLAKAETDRCFILIVFVFSMYASLSVYMCLNLTVP